MRGALLKKSLALSPGMWRCKLQVGFLAVMLWQLTFGVQVYKDGCSS